ncbi:MAG: dihydroneopterin aldolase [Oscillatoriales cyanobacterium SM2_2_1]|nr:dihydroneopterin aldolase [Oscillatoriales cyanobacterium SM2_2_1]
MAETKIYLNGVRAYGYVGLLPEEQILGQWFAVDAVLTLDWSAAATSDDIADTYDYRTAIGTIHRQIQTGRYKLVERLAGAIAQELFTEPRLGHLHLKVIKQPPIPDFQGSVAVEISGDRTHFSPTPASIATPEAKPAKKKSKPSTLTAHA